MSKIAVLLSLLACLLASRGALAEGGDWSGAYVGGQFGQGWSGFDYAYNGSEPVGLDGDGAIGGLTVGYNWQKERWVFGVEGDYSWSDSGSATLANAVPCYEDGCDGRVKAMASARFRVGYAVQRLLPYLTLGAAYADIKANADLGACGYVGYCGFDTSAWGWTYGAGVEWRIDPRWSAKAEYLYSTFDAPAFSDSAVTASDVDLSVLRLGVNYRF